MDFLHARTFKPKLCQLHLRFNLSSVSLVKVGVLSGGGDAPGINAVIRAVVRKGIQVYGYEIVGIRDGWDGLLKGEFV